MADQYFNTNCGRCGKPRTTANAFFTSPYCRSCASMVRWQRDRKHPEQLTCKKCGKSFPFAASGSRPRVFCSPACRSNQITKTCAVCKTDFSIAKSNADRYNVCSASCRSTLYFSVTTQCGYCGQSFRHQHTQKRAHCSLACYRKASPESPIEMKVRHILEQAGIPFEREFQLEKNAIYDFYLPDVHVLIECDGEYWHGQARMVQSDQRKNAIAKQRGFGIIRFAETVINQPEFNKQLLDYIQTAKR